MPAKSPARSGCKEPSNRLPKEDVPVAEVGDFDNSVIFDDEVPCAKSPPSKKPSQRRGSRGRTAKTASAADNHQIQPEPPKPTVHHHRNEGGKCPACGQATPAVEEQDQAPVPVPSPSPRKAKPVEQPKKTASNEVIQKESGEAAADQPVDELPREKNDNRVHRRRRISLFLCAYVISFSMMTPAFFINPELRTSVSKIFTALGLGHDQGPLTTVKNIMMPSILFSFGARGPSTVEPVLPELSAQDLKESSQAPVTPAPAQPVPAVAPAPAAVAAPVTPTPAPITIEIENLAIPSNVLTQNHFDDQLGEIKSQLAELLAAQKQMQVEKQPLHDLKEEVKKSGKEDVAIEDMKSNIV